MSWKMLLMFVKNFGIDIEIVLD